CTFLPPAPHVFPLSFFYYPCPPRPPPSFPPRRSPDPPSPITTSPEMSTRSNTPLIASQAAASALSFSPRPSQCSTLRAAFSVARSEEHTSELQSLTNLVCRLLLEKKNTQDMHCTRPRT